MLDSLVFFDQVKDIETYSPADVPPGGELEVLMVQRFCRFSTLFLVQCIRFIVTLARREEAIIFVFIYNTLTI